MEADADAPRPSAGDLTASEQATVAAGVVDDGAEEDEEEAESMEELRADSTSVEREGGRHRGPAAGSSGEIRTFGGGPPLGREPPARVGGPREYGGPETQLSYESSEGEQGPDLPPKQLLWLRSAPQGCLPKSAVEEGEIRREIEKILERDVSIHRGTWTKEELREIWELSLRAPEGSLTACLVDKKATAMGLDMTAWQSHIKENIQNFY
eukprot:gene41533-8924_t